MEATHAPLHHLRYVCFVAVCSVCGNTLVLYLDRPKPIITTRLQGRLTIKYFVRSLALSDLMSALLAIPLLLAELTTDFLSSDLVCRVHRYFQIVPIFITITNMVLLGVERYLIIYYPHKAPSRMACKRMVVVAWFVGATLAVIHPGCTSMLKTYPIGTDQYTRLCKVAEDPLSKALNLAISIVVIFIPALTLVVMSIRILMYLHRKRLQSCPVQSSCSIISTLRHYKLSYMAASVILAFFCSYLFAFVYTSVIAGNFTDTTIADEYTTRIVGMVISLATCMVNSLIYLVCLWEMRKKAEEAFQDLFLHIHHMITREGNSNEVGFAANPQAVAVIMLEPREP
ncbi:neuropeptide S receptor [Nematostella vectensis]|uniref:neuropeptide S receptor n=1 Tax=Nematostella vectensis TaxID=45351 RepID=UPI00207766F3|nr:neuropeptide S receptor [Nematostella vectensis]